MQFSPLRVLSSGLSKIFSLHKPQWSFPMSYQSELAFSISIIITKKYPLSFLKPRSLALIEQYLPNISDPVYSVHQSFMWFLWLNWRKSTFYPVEWFKMLTYCDVIDSRQQLWHHNDRLFPRGCYGRFLSIFCDPRVSTRGIASRW